MGQPAVVPPHKECCAQKCNKVKVSVIQLCPTLCNLIDWNSPWNCPGQNTGVGSLSLLQGIFSMRGSNPGLPHCRQILNQLSHQGSPRTLDWIPSQADLPDPGIKPRSPALQVDFLPPEEKTRPTNRLPITVAPIL